MSEKDGGSAFPVPHDALVDRGGCVQGYAHEHMPIESGMSLRDYFAAKAMAALIDPAQHNSDRINGYLSAHEGLEGNHDGFITVRAYEIADAMLKARGQ